MAKAIIVRDRGDGDYEIVRGGVVYQRSASGTVPIDVRRGENASAAAICEWISFGANVETIGSRRAA